MKIFINTTRITLKPRKRERAMATKTLIVARTVWVSKTKGLSNSNLLSSNIGIGSGCRNSFLILVGGGLMTLSLCFEMLQRERVAVSDFAANIWGTKVFDFESRGWNCREQKHSAAMDGYFATNKWRRRGRRRRRNQ